MAGRARQATQASAPSAGNTSTLPSGPTVPPLSQTGPIAWLSSRLLPGTSPLLGAPNRKDSDQSQVACTPNTHHSEPVRQIARQATKP
ncbi:hypothetical protein XF14_14350 [Burkholderia gladioli]|nr:hypothetical protein XF14_14350 [Burkholderia gladioli]